MALNLSVRLEGFFAPHSSTTIEMPTSWVELAGCAASVGRDVSWTTAGVPPATLAAERIWRSLMIRTTLQQSGLRRIERLRRTRAFETMDGSEKGAISFFLGQAIAKHIAEKLFGCIVFAHVDAALRAVGIQAHGTRPDFVGLRADGTTILMEAKGRSSSSARALADAKGQVQALPSVGSVGLRCASLSYFTPSGELKVAVLDPDGSDGPTVDPRPAIAMHYERLARLTEGSAVERGSDGSEASFVVRLVGSGIALRIPQDVLIDAAALGQREFGVQEFAARLVERHRRPDLGPEPRQVLATRPSRDLVLARPMERRPFLTEMAAVSRRAEELGSLRHADGIVVTVDRSWSPEQMSSPPEDRDDLS